MKKLFSRIGKFLLKISLWFIAISITLVILFRWVPIYFTPLMVKRCIEQKADGKEMKLEKTWKPLTEISPSLQLAVVCSEDQNYLKHYGFDFGAIKKAIEHNKKSKRKRGASTISQQTAKNVFLWDGRSWVRKGFEVYFTFLIELFWSKERIMEVYLNVIEMGDGIYGAEAASQAYFKKSAIDISKQQAATISAILPSPLKYNAKKPSAFLQGRINWTLQQMRFWGGKLDYDKEEKKK
ncbi:monofunctional biosynthetic peptidoglycan transglycosylase [Vicingus serpentipes]|uniref:Biosynthetic peptidoglycan transglycosylase n=1 Tax=Vicingus serpentipes TaxID=1926625 RepID=A0A5C6RRI1_9FLAO|nr:monofunctional biosynthetic peptidoglycan transglycosylase [Vicingus serpentipes]TXB64002.1 monofunctional biosynthetic peptidoglycan transglycosylase [Vicingus serpentipes]